MARTFQNVRLFKELTAFDNVRIACHAGSRSGFTSAWMLTPTHDAEEERIRQRATDFLAVLELSHRRDELARNLPYGEGSGRERGPRWLRRRPDGGTP